MSTKYNKFWLSLIGPAAAALTAFGGLDATVAEGLAATAASLLGSLAVVFGPANSTK